MLVDLRFYSFLGQVLTCYISQPLAFLNIQPFLAANITYIRRKFRFYAPQHKEYMILNLLSQK